MSRAGGECYACGAPIRWVKLAPRFKPHPIDPKPSREHGTIHADDQGRATILPKEHIEKARAARVELYVSHFATCPDAARMRRPTTPIPEPASPVRSLVLEPPQIPGPRGKERPLTEGEIQYLEAVRASEAASSPPSKPSAVDELTALGQSMGGYDPPPPPPPLPPPKNRAERRARAHARELTHTPTEMFASYQDVMNGIAAAAGYDGARDFHKLCEHIAKQRAAACSPADLERLRQAVEMSEAKIAELTAVRAELRARKAAPEPEIGGEWLRELRALRAELEASGNMAARAVLRELAGRLGYRLR